MIVASLPFKHQEYINLTELRLQHTEQHQQRIKNVCSRLYESHHIEWNRFFVNDQRKYIYCPIPKAACSSWKLTLLRLTGKDISNVISVHYAKQTDKILKRAEHYNATELESRLKNYYKFMFVREPLERLVSAYRDKCFRDPAHSWLSPAIKKRRRLHNNKQQGESRIRMYTVRQKTAPLYFCNKK